MSKEIFEYQDQAFREDIESNRLKLKDDLDKKYQKQYENILWKTPEERENAKKSIDNNYKIEFEQGSLKIQKAAEEFHYPDGGRDATHQRYLEENSIKQTEQEQKGKAADVQYQQTETIREQEQQRSFDRQQEDEKKKKLLEQEKQQKALQREQEKATEKAKEKEKDRVEKDEESKKEAFRLKMREHFQKKSMERGKDKDINR